MGWLYWIIIGIVAGAVARMIVPGEVGGGILMDLVVGLLGAIIGGWIAQSLFATSAGGGTVWTILISILGAVVLLLILRLATGRRARV